MELNSNEVRRIVIESLLEILHGDGRSEIPEINDQTDPIRELGLTSEDGIEVACLLSCKLKFEIPLEINPFTDDARQRSRRVGQIVHLLLQLLEEKGVAHHA